MRSEKQRRRRRMSSRRKGGGEFDELPKGSSLSGLFSS